MTSEICNTGVELVDRIFDQLLDLDPGAREAALSAACNNDPDLMEKVSTLLMAVETSQAFFEEVGRERDAILGEALDARGLFEGEGSLVRAGDTLNGYRLERIIGEGGKATVYLGTKSEEGWEQTAALKIMKRGVDTDDVYRRFLSERQILTLLNHSHIASLMDGGTTDDGLPYFILEYVDGDPIDVWCDSQGVDFEGRLALFLDVAEAIEYAHRHLVIHRDIKPSNILVNTEGVVKLLDFGIAKLVEPIEGPAPVPLTLTQSRPLTPAYASPEQISGAPITTATDVYQLGLLLYRLLAGVLPSFGENSEEATPSRTSLPPPPSRSLPKAQGTMRKHLYGDLDTIVLKALMPEPEARYPSVRAMSDDIRRHLEKKPIEARPASKRYRVGKFLVRHPWVAPVASVFSVAIISYVVLLTVFLDRVANERDRAEEIKGLVVDLFSSADPLSGIIVGRGRDLTMVEFLDVAAQRTRSEFSGRPDLKAELLSVLSNAYGEIGLPEKALPLLEDAIGIEETLYGEGSLPALTSMRGLGSLKIQMDAVREGEALFREALKYASDGGRRFDVEEARLLFELGKHYLDRVSMREGTRYLDRAAAVLRATPEAPSDLLESVLLRLVQVVKEPDRLPEMERLGREVLASREVRFGAESGAASIALAQISLADTVGSLGKKEEARALLEEAIPVLERQYGSDHAIVTAVMNNLAVLLITAFQEYDRARTIQENLIEIEMLRWGENHAEVGMRWQNLAATLYRLKDIDGTVEATSKARSIFLRTIEPGMYLHAMPDLTVSAVYLDEGAFGDAERVARRALGILEDALPETSRPRLMARCRLGRALMGQGRMKEGRAHVEAAILVLETLGPAAKGNLGECQAALASR